MRMKLSPHNSLVGKDQLDWNREFNYSLNAVYFNSQVGRRWSIDVPPNGMAMVVRFSLLVVQM